MRLIVEDEARQFDQQTHAYAEYWAFSALRAPTVQSRTSRSL
jgi:hypothetical protein